MSLLKVLVKVVIGLVIVVALSAYIFINNFDLNKYKDDISMFAEEKLGRKLAINGEAKLGLSFSPTLIVNDVELANADWASSPQMVKVGSLEIKLALLPLLHRQFVIDNLVLSGVEINLEVAADGAQNWNFGGSEAGKVMKNVTPAQVELMKDQAIASGLVDMKTADKAAEMVRQNPASLALAGFAAKNVLIENGRFSLINHKENSQLQTEIIRFSMVVPDMQSEVNAEFDLMFNGQSIKGKTTLGKPELLISGNGAYPVSAELGAYGVTADISATLHDIQTDLSYAVTASIHNPQGNMGAPDVKLDAQVSGNRQVVSAVVQRLDINGNIFTGTVDANISEKTPYAVVDLQSDLLNLQTLKPASGQKNAQFLPDIIASAKASQFVPDIKIPFAAMGALNAKAAVAVKILQLSPDIVLEDVSLNASLLNGVLEVNPLKASAGGGNFNAVVSVDSAARSMKLTAVGSGIVLPAFYAKLKAPADGSSFGFVSGGAADFDVRLSGTGDTYRQLVNSLKGSAVAIVDKSTVHPGALEALTGNFIMQILHTLKLDSMKEKNLDLNCAVVRADVSNGVVDFPKGIAISSKQLNLVSSGKYTLLNDGLDFSVRPYSGQIVDANLAQALSSFIKIKGTAQNPKIVLDDTQALKALVGIAATGGTAYLGSQLVLDADSTPCYTALKGTPYQSRFPGPGAIQKAGQEIYQGADDTVKDSVNDVKQQLKSSAQDVKKSLKDLENAAKGFLQNLQLQRN